MRRNCDLELRLLPPSASLQSTHNNQDQNHHYYHHQPMVDWLSIGSPIEKQQQQKLTIFYNGRISVCDATELQAKAIIMLASREVEEKIKSPSISEPSSPLLQSEKYGSTSTPTGLSMKRSLQRFLQKRQNRIQATSPYHH